MLAAAALALSGCSSEPTYRDADPGQCVREGSANGNDMSVVECDDAEAKWVVVAQHETGGADACAEEVDADIVISDEESGAATCLRFNGVEGDCAWTDLSGFSDCATDGGLRLEAILTDAADATGCPDATTQGRVYSDGIVYCWVPHTPTA